MAESGVARVPYKVKGRSIEACNCDHGCNCQFGGFPNDGKCEFIIGYEIDHGNFGFTRLDGMLAVLAGDRKSTRLNSSHIPLSRMPSSA